MARAYIGIGANLGDAKQHVRDAIAALGALADTQLVAVSSLYRTAPVGYLDQPDFINAVAAIDTPLEPHALLDALHEVEERFGRERSFKDAPRTLDLDVLLYDQRIIGDDVLVVPHPRMHERAFVLAPLIEIASDCVIPQRGSAQEWLARCADQAIEKL
ncbi:MAG TPA: 2-amino-4-hydroxy-6-hydroxymethyldihydropteridine diphosphokinase [Burkholderiales bacterium]